jgi:hypothetical protein
MISETRGWQLLYLWAACIALLESEKIVKLGLGCSEIKRSAAIIANSSEVKMELSDLK